jgi:hypothetical protein
MFPMNLKKKFEFGTVRFGNGTVRVYESSRVSLYLFTYFYKNGFAFAYTVKNRIEPLKHRNIEKIRIPRTHILFGSIRLKK